jgi:hypothetical protein
VHEESAPGAALKTNADFLDPPVDCLRSPQRPQGVVLVDPRDAEERQDRIARVFLDDAAVIGDNPGAFRQNLLRDFSNLLRVELLAQIRVTRYVGEKSRNLLSLVDK